MTDHHQGQAALVTGCSTGIGRASAVRLHDAGLTVYATARKVETLDELKSRGIRTLPLDVTDEQSMVTAVRAVEDADGTVSILVNNAGYGLYGPVEQLPMEEIRRQFETNFFGLVRMIQLVLPGMRAARRGRILNVSSMGGRVTLPGGAFYHASKHAVESLSDALRIEVRPFGIDVVLIEPGPVKTPWNDVAAASISAAAHPGDVSSTDDDDPYAGFKACVGSSFGAVERGGAVSRLSSTADDIARVVTKAATGRRPRTRYLINPLAKGLVALSMLPDRAYDAVLKRQYGLP
jgi:NAD(P)-dependent dehydrogenase (short-subunit alcohol dehydrogenase family)